jgi:hypothetical protein
MLFLYPYTVWAEQLSGYTVWLGLNDPGIESLWMRNFLRPFGSSLRPIQPHIQWVMALFPEGKAKRGVELTTQPIYCLG